MRTWINTLALVLLVGGCADDEDPKDTDVVDTTGDSDDTVVDTDPMDSDTDGMDTDDTDDTDAMAFVWPTTCLLYTSPSPRD